MSETSTKERILDAAEEIMLERSFHSVGLNQILSAVKVPKGSFYHYFKSKEQFGVEMLHHYSNTANARKRQLLFDTNPERDPIERLFCYFETSIESVEKNEGRCPCLIQKLAAEVSNFSEPMREALAKGCLDTTAIFKKVLDEAVAKGSLADNFDTATEADFILLLWIGALQRTLIFRNVEALRFALVIFRSRLTNLS